RSWRSSVGSTSDSVSVRVMIIDRETGGFMGAMTWYGYYTHVQVTGITVMQLQEASDAASAGGRLFQSSLRAESLHERVLSLVLIWEDGREDPTHLTSKLPTEGESFGFLLLAPSTGLDTGKDTTARCARGGGKTQDEEYEPISSEPGPANCSVELRYSKNSERV
ncbi:hypothetical protein EXIGLDRAFT_693213, partial [Exidia glandulosa HHB12029]